MGRIYSFGDSLTSMEALFGIVGKDFVLVAADELIVRSIMVVKSTEDKSRRLSNHIEMLYSGDAGDSVAFSEFIQANLKLNEIQQGFPISTRAAATFTRNQLSTSLRSRVCPMKLFHVNSHARVCVESVQRQHAHRWLHSRSGSRTLLDRLLVRVE